MDKAARKLGKCCKLEEKLHVCNPIHVDDVIQDVAYKSRIFVLL